MICYMTNQTSFCTSVLHQSVWNTKGRIYLNAHNKDWLKEFAIEITEAKRKVKNIYNHPYINALGTGKNSGLRTWEQKWEQMP